MNYHGKSDVGRSRADNQDCFVSRQSEYGPSLFAVCDGVGGAYGGEVASALVIQVFADSVFDMVAERCVAKKALELSESAVRDILTRALELARERVCETARSDEKLSAMSTTIVALFLCGQIAYILNVGDSRAYIFASGTLTRLTKDHSYVQELVDSGAITSDDASRHKFKNVITRSVGLTTDSMPDMYKVSLSELGGYSFLLCSDGLTNMVDENEIESIVGGTGSVRSKVDKLIQSANRNGGLDNITVLLINEKG